MEVVPCITQGLSRCNMPLQMDRTGRTEMTGSREQQTHVLHLWQSGDFSDAILSVEGFDFHVHRNILSCCSDYFRALFMNQLQQPQAYSTVPKYEQGDTGQSKNVHKSKPIQTRRKISFTTSNHSNSVIEKTSPLPFPGNQQTQRTKNSNRTSHGLIKTPSDSAYETNRVSNVNSRRRARFHVVLTEVNVDVMGQILEYAYGGHVTLTRDNVEPILNAADRFQVTSLVHDCCGFLSDQLSIDNCISMTKLSSNFYQSQILKTAARQFILENFHTISKISPEFEQLTASELCSFLVDDSLNIEREENILDVIVKWVEADLESREAYIPSLVKCARVGSFLPGQMPGSMALPQLSPGTGTSPGSDVFIKVMNAVLERQQQLTTNSDFSMFDTRLPRDVMFIIGGSNFGYPLGIVEAFDGRTWNWHDIGAYDFAPRSYHGVAQVDKHVYVIGGFDGQSYLSSCCRFSPDADMNTWESVTPMHTKRCYVGVGQIQGTIYAIGGFDGVYRLNSAERFDPATNQWSFIAPMTHHRSDAGVAVLDDKIYVCGGFSGSECIKTVEMYDPDREEWSVQPAMPHDRSGLGVASYGGCLYAVGGFNGLDSSVRLAVMESFNPDTKQWTTLSPMPHPRSNLAVTVMEDTLYAIGGYNGERTSAVVECYNFEKQSWYQTTRLSQSRSALSVCVLSRLSNTAALLGRDNDDEYNGDVNDDDVDVYDEQYYDSFVSS